MTVTKRTYKPTTKGFSCPTCRGVRLHVSYVERPAPNLVVRGRKCSCCGRRTITEERIAKARRVRGEVD